MIAIHVVSPNFSLEQQRKAGVYEDSSADTPAGPASHGFALSLGSGSSSALLGATLTATVELRNVSGRPQYAFFGSRGRDYGFTIVSHATCQVARNLHTGSEGNRALRNGTAPRFSRVHPSTARSVSTRSTSSAGSALTPCASKGGRSLTVSLSKCNPTLIPSRFDDRRIAALCLAAVATPALHWATAIGMIRWSPDVVHDLRVLPGRPLSETVVTKTPQSIEVMIALVAAADVADISRPGGGGRLIQTPSRPSFCKRAERGDRLQNIKSISRLSPRGCTRFAWRARNARPSKILSVGTIGAVINRGNNGAVVLAIDARTLRMRRDVVVLDYGLAGVRRFFPSKDGLIHVPAPAAPQGVLCSPDDVVVVRASDGSAVSFSGTGCNLGLATYFDTDRHMYRAGDLVHYRIFSRDATTNTYATVVGGNFWYTKASRTVNHVTDGGFMLP